VAYRGEIKLDCKRRRNLRAARRRRQFLLATLVLGCAVFMLGLGRPGTPAPTAVPRAAPVSHTLDLRERAREALASETAVPAPQAASAAPAYPFEPLVGRAASPAAQAPAVEGEWVEVTVAPGDNLSLIFTRNDLSGADLHRILSIGGPTQGLKRLLPGQIVRLRTVDGELVELVHEQSLLRALHVERDGESFTAQLLETEPEKRVVDTTAEIDSSLFLSGQAAGLADKTILELAEIFGWDIDFVLDIRAGDRFSVIHETYLKDGRKVRDGPILAAEFTNRGRTLRAVRYVDADGRAAYYSETGAAMRKAFLRTPVNFTRISSHFNLKRRHPVLNTIRAHRGVDYAAPHGTPVKATGDGKVVAAATNGGYGRMVQLQHGGSYHTVYAHLSRFARGIRPGQSVRQGQTIGYVGSTGLATGPHLHYEFRVNGVHKNPLTVDLPKALPIPDRYRRDFAAKAQPLLAELDRLAGQWALAARADRNVASAAE